MNRSPVTRQQNSTGLNDANDDLARSSPSETARASAEWFTLGISLAILFGVFGIIAYVYLRGDDNPPAIRLVSRFDELRYEQELYYLPIEVINGGDITAQNVLIQAELETGSDTPTSADITITYLAGGERAEATFIFKDDPRQGTLTLQAVSYNVP